MKIIQIKRKVKRKYKKYIYWSNIFTLSQSFIYIFKLWRSLSVCFFIIINVKELHNFDHRLKRKQKSSAVGVAFRRRRSSFCPRKISCIYAYFFPYRAWKFASLRLATLRYLEIWDSFFCSDRKSMFTFVIFYLVFHRIRFAFAFFSCCKWTDYELTGET